MFFFSFFLWMNFLIPLCLTFVSPLSLWLLCSVCHLFFCWFVYGWTQHASDSTGIAHDPTVCLESSKMRSCSSSGVFIRGASAREPHILCLIMTIYFWRKKKKNKSRCCEFFLFFLFLSWRPSKKKKKKETQHLLLFSCLPGSPKVISSLFSVFCCLA